jgi:hypothetical protein
MLVWGAAGWGQMWEPLLSGWVRESQLGEFFFLILGLRDFDSDRLCGQTHNFNGFHHGVRPEVACEEADPEEGRLLREVWVLRFDVVGGLVFTLCTLISIL